MAKKTKAVLEAENKILRRSNLSQGIVAVAQTLVRTGGAVAIVFFCREAIGDLAGKSTDSDISFTLAGFDFVADGMKPGEIVAYVVSVASILYGYLQKRLKKKIIEKMHFRTEELERKIDPKRSSSHLTSSGDTRPEDS